MSGPTGEGASGPGLPLVTGHREVRDRLRLSARAGRLPQSLLLHGPPGVGKRTLALWSAALLACRGPEAPCRACRSCKLAARLEHPDIHYHFPMPRPAGGGSRRKLRERLEAQRLERLAELREPGSEPAEAVGKVTGIYLAAVEEIRAQAARRPAMGSIAVFVIAEADRMVPQSANPEAANAFLKLLEEPPEYGHLILTSSRPAALLPTIRSRTAALRVPPLARDEVEEHLTSVSGIAGGPARRAARRAQGSIGRALGLVTDDGGAGGPRADRLLEAALGADEGARLAVAATFSARGARTELAQALDGLEERLRDLLALSAGGPADAIDAEGAEALLRGGSVDPARALRCLELVQEAREGAARNLNPQATVAVLLADLANACRGPAATPA